MFRFITIIIVVFVFVSLAGNAFADKVSEMLLPSATVISKVGVGTAIAINTDAGIGTFLITNLHVIAKQKTVLIQMYGKTDMWNATIFAYDVVNDIAILVIPTIVSNVAILGDPSDVSLFAQVICVGNPLSAGIVPSAGIITAVNAMPPGRKQRMDRTDCGIAPGSSGGGVFTQRADNVWVYVGIPTDILQYKLRLSWNVMGSQIIPMLGYTVTVKSIRTLLKANGILPSYNSIVKEQ